MMLMPIITRSKIVGHGGISCSCCTGGRGRKRAKRDVSRSVRRAARLLIAKGTP